MTRLFTLPQLPPMKCDAGCGECCTIVGVSRSGFRRIERVIHARGINPVKQGLRCPLYIDGKCSIYEARPALCRLYGHVEEMKCPRGYNVNVHARTEREYARVIAEGGPKNSVLLHSLVYTHGEFESVLLDEYRREVTQ